MKQSLCLPLFFLLFLRASFLFAIIFPSSSLHLSGSVYALLIATTLLFVVLISPLVRVVIMFLSIPYPLCVCGVFVV
ncbi:hypothetical protein, partial [Bartonella grahamii]|uniref:hypothetical protein n=1 Tax=Bartonella grahamii TaxID=33045 RepID=UPI001ABB4798